ncbi:hypothetical protein [Faecalimonas sp.]
MEIEYFKNGDYLITKIKEETPKMRVGETETASKKLIITRQMVLLCGM